MPEYLAPGVYVEETSFRSKSIEGVSTSTTGMVGPARRGPVGGTPEIITSFGDYERIYGGLQNFGSGFGDEYGETLNYLAHAVRAYFNEGGARLYVSRAFTAIADDDAGVARSAPIVSSAAEDDSAEFVARFPGAGGNGLIAVEQVELPASFGTMGSALAGTLVRIGGPDAKVPASIEGGTPTFDLKTNDGHGLFLDVNSQDKQIVFKGKPATALGDRALPASFAIPAEDSKLLVTIDGETKTVHLDTLPDDPANAGQKLRDAVRDRINQVIAAEIRLAAAGDAAPANALVIETRHLGYGANLSISPNATLGFPNGISVRNRKDADNNVHDLRKLSIDDIHDLLHAANVEVEAVESPSGKLVLRTLKGGGPDDVRLMVRNPQGEDSVHQKLGLTPNVPKLGSDTSPVRYFRKKADGTWVDRNGNAPPAPSRNLAQAPEGAAAFLSVTVDVTDADGNGEQYADLAFFVDHPGFIGRVLAEKPERRSDQLEQVFAIRIGDKVSGFALYDDLLKDKTAEERRHALTGGNDGAPPTAAAYRKALDEFKKLEDISIVAAPGHSKYQDFGGIQRNLISHAESRRAYRIAVLDTPPDQVISEAREVRSQIDSKYAALYYPWIEVSNPLARPGATDPREIKLPPSGFMCGIYARNDVQRGVHKAPANEVVRAALRFETDINFDEQGVLNPLGVNCLRFFPGRGYRVWGARLVSSDPEWKYVSDRRYFNYLERSIDQGTQWVVFEPNGERLWANVRETISAFLYTEWVNGRLLGTSPQEAFFVRCDRSTMTQNDLDNGRLICLIGVAIIRPAEFVIFRIGQKTADAS